jgi:hypothetical protein
MLIQLDLQVLTQTLVNFALVNPFKTVEPRTGAQLFLFLLQHAGHEVQIYHQGFNLYENCNEFGKWLDLHRFPRHIRTTPSVDSSGWFVGHLAVPFDVANHPSDFDALTKRFAPGI